MTKEAFEFYRIRNRLHANAYVTKPVDFEQFIAAIRQVDDFFLTLVQLPPDPGR